MKPMNNILDVNPKYKSRGKVNKWCQSECITKNTRIDYSVSSKPHNS